MNIEQLCARWNVDAAGLKRIIGDRDRITAGEVDLIESRWHLELQARRQAWNQQLQARKVRA